MYTIGDQRHICGTTRFHYCTLLWYPNKASIVRIVAVVYYNKSTKYACFHLQFLRGVLLGEKILGSLYVTDSTVLEFGFFTYSY